MIWRRGAAKTPVAKRFAIAWRHLLINISSRAAGMFSRVLGRTSRTLCTRPPRGVSASEYRAAWRQSGNGPWLTSVFSPASTQNNMIF